MENNKKFELNDETLGEVAGGEDGDVAIEWRDLHCEKCNQTTRHSYYRTPGNFYEINATCPVCNTKTTRLTRTVF